MSSIIARISRTFSDDVKTYYNSHPTAPSSGLRASSMGNSDFQDGQHKLQVRTRESREATRDTESEAGSPTASSLDNPTSAAAESTTASPQKKDYSINGMQPYDYWYLIKSL